jgi:Iodothyronine deiodinase
MAKLFSISEQINSNNISVILIQIDEAHSTAWPMAIDNALKVEQPEPQKSLEDRFNRVKYFVNTYHPPYPVFVDTWNNDFAEMFRAWPDKYHCINKDFEVIAKSDYHNDEQKEATVIEDCTDVLIKLIKNKIIN